MLKFKNFKKELKIMKNNYIFFVILFFSQVLFSMEEPDKRVEGKELSTWEKRKKDLYRTLYENEKKDPDSKMFKFQSPKPKNEEAYMYFLLPLYFKEELQDHEGIKALYLNRGEFYKDRALLMALFFYVRAGNEEKINEVITKIKDTTNFNTDDRSIYDIKYDKITKENFWQHGDLTKHLRFQTNVRNEIIEETGVNVIYTVVINYLKGLNSL